MYGGHLYFSVRNAVIVLLIIFLGALEGVSASEGRAISAEIRLDQYILFSDEKLSVEVIVKGVQFGTTLDISIILEDAFGEVARIEDVWYQQKTQTIKNYTMHSFFSGNQYYTANVELYSSQNLVAETTSNFTVIRRNILPTISDILVFGDSLSDMGNAKSSILNVPDTPPYWNGRFSNGPVWIEHLSQAYGINTTYGSSTNSGDNRAFGGSQTGQGYSYVLLPNVGTQIDSYISNVKATFGQDELVVLWAGGNDFLYGSGDPDVISSNMISHITALASAGAEKFLIANLPPLEQTPEGSSRSVSEQNRLAAGVVEYNNKLDAGVTGLISALNIRVDYIDVHTLFNEIVGNASHLGITNTADSACSSSGSILPLPICNSGDTVANNVDEYLYFDKAHPTASMHLIIGKYVQTLIGTPDTDNDGIEDANDLCPWTMNSTVNQDGCSWEQLDEDGDGVSNGVDHCTDTPATEIADENGCSPTQRDSDSDGMNDAIDPCPLDNSGPDHDSDGCIDDSDDDDDNDGVSDVNDLCPKGMIGLHSLDGDLDGCHDDEDQDDDGDGVLDVNDLCAGYDDRVDQDQDGLPDGCDSLIDNDGDGVGNLIDKCQNTKHNESVNAEGCSLTQLDSDSDGMNDAIDPCPFDNSGPDHDSDGCIDDSDEDDDGDGIPDLQDYCPLGVKNSSASDFDNDGCHDDEDGDDDGDGVSDVADLCQNEDDKIDVDRDQIPDACDSLLDSDGDHIADLDDICEGYNDSIDEDQDSIPDGCDNLVDSDGDGVANSEDVCEGYDDNEDADSDRISDGCDSLIDSD